MADDIVTRLRDTLTYLRNKNTPIRYRQAIHDAIHQLTREERNETND